MFFLTGILRLPACVWCPSVLGCTGGVSAADANDANANVLLLLLMLMRMIMIMLMLMILRGNPRSGWHLVRNGGFREEPGERPA